MSTSFVKSPISRRNLLRRSAFHRSRNSVVARTAVRRGGHVRMPEALLRESSAQVICKRRRSGH